MHQIKKLTTKSFNIMQKQYNIKNYLNIKYKNKTHRLNMF